jgi:hypothetical protein
MRLAGHVARMEEKRGVYSVLVGNLRERDHLEYPGVDNIKMELREVSMNWINLAQDRDRWRALVSAVMNVLVP